MPFGMVRTSGCRPSFLLRRGSSLRLKPAAVPWRTRLRRSATSPTSTICRNFLDVWNSHFGEHPCALTVVATKGLALLESILEINIFGVRNGAKTRKEIVDHKPSQHMRLGPAAVRAGDLLCLSGLYAADSDGAIPQARSTA